MGMPRKKGACRIPTPLSPSNPYLFRSLGLGSPGALDLENLPTLFITSPRGVGIGCGFGSVGALLFFNPKPSPQSLTLSPEPQSLSSHRVGRGPELEKYLLSRV